MTITHTSKRPAWSAGHVVARSAEVVDIGAALVEAQAFTRWGICGPKEPTPIVLVPVAATGTRDAGGDARRNRLEVMRRQLGLSDRRTGR